MAQSNRALFMEESDEDSIPTDSTEASEHENDESFSVEKILAYHQNHDNSGHPAYLIKWEGYELGRSSWEPPENLEDERLIQDFEDEQARVKKGLAVQFDEQDFVEAVNNLNQRTYDRHRRRVAKRQRRAERKAPWGDRTQRKLLSEDRQPKGNAEDSSDENESGATRSRGLQSGNPSAIRRKGIAQEIQPRRRFVLESSSDEADEKSPDMDDDSTFNSLFDEGSQPLYQETPTSETQSSKTGTSSKPLESRPEEISKPESNALKTAMAIDEHNDLPQKAARKSVTTPGPSKANTASKNAKRSNVFAKPNENLLHKKQRPDTSGSTAQEGAFPKFTNLAIQNRYKKYARAEPIPDPSMLTMIDPKTGKRHSSDRSAIERDAMNVQFSSRRESRRSFTPPTLEPQPGEPSENLAPLSNWRRREVCWFWLDGTCQRSAAACPFAHDSQPSKDVPPPPPPPPAGEKLPDDRRRTKTCEYWRQGTCRFPAENCDFAHWEIDKGSLQSTLQRPLAIQSQAAASTSSAHDNPKAKQTCYWWLKGHCKYSDKDCEHAHEDTGVYSESVQRLKDKKSLECHFWRLGSCKKSAGQCAFAHHPTGLYAPPPGAHKLDPNSRDSRPSRFAGYSPVHTTGANSEPVTDLSLGDADTPAARFRSPSSTTVSLANRARTVTDTAPQPVAPQPVTNGDVGAFPAQIQIDCEGGITTVKMDVDLEVIALKKFKALLAPAPQGAFLCANQLVTASDFCAFQVGTMPDQSWPSGTIMPLTDSQGAAATIVETCRLHSAGLVAMKDEYTLLIYPRNADEWSFLDSVSTGVAKAPLRFRLLPPLPDFDRGESTQYSRNLLSMQQPANTVGNSLLGLDEANLIPKGADRAVFICWPELQGADMKLIAQYLQGLKYKVYSSNDPGAWEYFRHKYSKAPSTIICHPDAPIWEMSKLYSLLINNGHAKFVAVSRRRMNGDTEHGQPLFQSHNIFPHGKVIFITDDVFCYNPDKAAEIIEQFVRDNAAKPVGGQHDRIAARPGIKSWLAKSALERTSDRGRQDLRWMNLYHKICTLCPLEDEDPDDFGRLLPSSNLISIPPEELPSFQGLWEKDEQAATELMVNWFAGFAFAESRHFRRFFVCHEPRSGGIAVDENGKAVNKVPKDPKNWSAKYSHIAVMGPDEILSEMQKKRLKK
ncbi:hypothetical protein KC340_g11051 [Hortaea werneckii]|nr:hypothetical protein KC339_g10163 [Hortaea werneckii]KAI7229585.1 hypothetical protein KC365_g7967 [Hortaea werneckii]KAI7308450.1 hypothetical protein KC340_g11051 [Hortaea werneckii]KAI7385857.1 hypothetical protein KC328_g10119 [Hortaea werneckii]